MKKFLTLLIAAAFLTGTPLAYAANSGSCDLNSTPPTSTNTEKYICSADSGSLPAGCKAVDPAGSLDQGFTCNSVPTGYAAPSSNTLSCSDSSSCPSGYSCQHQSGGTGICVAGQANQCSGTDPSGTFDTATSTTVRSCSCDYKAGSYSWLCSSSVQTKAPTCGAKPDGATGCACVDAGTNDGKGEWQCQYTPSQQAQTPAAQPCGDACKLDYTPLEPLPGISGASKLDFVVMLNLAFKLLITAGALFAVGTLVMGGITYMTAISGEGIGEARKRIQASFFGLILMIAAYLILNTINPALTKLNIDNIGSLEPGGSSGGAAQQASASSGIDTTKCSPGAVSHLNSGEQVSCN